jgi:hypothetical protein
MPGTDTTDTPDIDAPIIPNATTYQREFLPAEKKASLFVRPPFPAQKDKTNTTDT